MRRVQFLTHYLWLIFFALCGLIMMGAWLLNSYQTPWEVSANQLLLYRLLIGMGALFFILLICGLLFRLQSRFTHEVRAVADEVQRLQLQTQGHTLPKDYPEILHPLINTYAQWVEYKGEKLKEFEYVKQQYESIFTSIPDPVMMINPLGRIQLANQAAIDLFSLPSDFSEQPFSAYIRNSQVHAFVEQLKKSPNQTHRVEVTYHPKQQDFPYILIFNGIGMSEPYGVLLAIHNVTSIRRMENFQREFVANVSHELKTPITIIQNTVENLQDGALEQEALAHTFLETIARNTLRLNAIIDDLLMLSRIENMERSKSLELEDFDLSTLIKESIQNCEHLAHQTQTTLVNQINDVILIEGARSLILQAINNLISNAIKYSPPQTTVQISAQIKNCNIAISVKDQGVGIESEHLPHIFHRFYRVDKGRSRHTGGTGLGLSIVKHIAQVHGGRVSVESEPHKGSCFTLYLPFKNK